MTRFPILFMLILLTGNIYAQTETDETQWKLPPMQILIDSALVHSPLMKSADASIEISEILLTDVRRNWLNRFSVGVDTRLGTFIDYRALQDYTGGTFVPLSVTKFMLNYSAGFSASVPITEFTDRKRKIQKAQLEIEISRNRKTELENQVKTVVIAAYFDALSIQKTLETRTQISSTASTLFSQSRLDFAENRISLDEYMKINEAYLSALNELELQKFAFLKAVYTLEIIVGIQLIK